MINSLILLLIITLTIFISGNNINENGGFLNKNYTNSLRGIAILIIMFCHITTAGFGIRYFTPLGGTGVAIFLFISGYGINESFKINGLKNYWIKKIIRVFIPYFFVTTIIQIVKCDLSFYEYMLDILCLKTRYWYIAFLFYQYILFYFLTRYFIKYRIMLFTIISLILFFVYPEIEAQQTFSFLSGFISSCYIMNIRKWSKKTFIKISIFSFSLGLLFLLLKQLPFIREHSGDILFNIIQCGIKLPFALFIIFIFSNNVKIQQSKMLLITGVISYEMYLIHFPFYGLINNSIANSLFLFIFTYILSFYYNKFNSVLTSRLVRNKFFR